MNNVILIGRLTRDVELRYTTSQMAVATFTLAIDRPTKADREKETDFPRVKAFGKTAENCEKYLTKGRMVAVQGSLQTGSYEDKDGKRVYTTDVIANRVEFLEWGDRPQGSAPRPQQTHVSEPASVSGGFDDEMPDSFQALDEDVPF